MRPHAIVLFACCTLIGCNQKSSNKPGAGGSSSALSSSGPSPLVGPTWTGNLAGNPMQIVFTQAGSSVQGEVRYTVFGAVRSKDQVTVAVGDDGTFHLKPRGTKNVLIGTPKMAELAGQLSADKTTLAGAAGTARWTVSSKANLADIDPPIDLAAAEKELLTAKWAGKMSARPATMVVTKKAGRLWAKIQADRDVTQYQLALDGTGHFTLTAQPRPTSQGLLTMAGRGYFLNHDLKRVRAVIDETVKQGFIEQSSDHPLMLEDIRK